MSPIYFRGHEGGVKITVSPAIYDLSLSPHVQRVDRAGLRYFKANAYRMCAKRPNDWDRYLPALLFAIREVPQEYLGFPPFELSCGRNVRAPMAILKELWSEEISDDQVLSIYQYVIDLI